MIEVYKNYTQGRQDEQNESHHKMLLTWEHPLKGIRQRMTKGIKTAIVTKRNLQILRQQTSEYKSHEATSREGRSFSKQSLINWICLCDSSCLTTSGPQQKIVCSHSGHYDKWRDCKRKISDQETWIFGNSEWSSVELLLLLSWIWPLHFCLPISLVFNGSTKLLYIHLLL